MSIDSGIGARDFFIRHQTFSIFSSISIIILNATPISGSFGGAGRPGNFTTGIGGSFGRSGNAGRLGSIGNGGNCNINFMLGISGSLRYGNRGSGIGFGTRCSIGISIFIAAFKSERSSTMSGSFGKEIIGISGKISPSSIHQPKLAYRSFVHIEHVVSKFINRSNSSFHLFIISMIVAISSAHDITCSLNLA